MAVEQKVIDRIVKLLALAGDNPNENEAASAAAKAQELLQQYDLSMSDVIMKQDPRTAGVGEGERIVLRKAGKPGGWKADLFRAVGYTTGCWSYASDAFGKWYDGTGYYIGRRQDVEIAEYLFAYLTREVERLQDEYGKTRWAELRQFAADRGVSTHYAEQVFSSRKRHPLKAKQDWVKGAVPQVIKVLREAKAERDNTSDAARALVISKESLIRDWYAQKQGFASWDDMQQQRSAKRGDAPTLEDKRTPAQKRRDDERAERAFKREQEKAQRAYAREAANLDWEAYEAGIRDGRNVNIRPAVR